MKRTMSIEALEAEVARLRGLLEAHGIEWRPLARGVREGGMARGAREKVALFRGLTRTEKRCKLKLPGKLSQK